MLYIFYFRFIFLITVYQDALLLEYFNKFSKELFYLKFDIIFLINIKFMFVNNIIPNIPRSCEHVFWQKYIAKNLFCLIFMILNCTCILEQPDIHVLVVSK